tara:strand:- start:1153 stop:1821 length:669 start_codon:yes stop_codon:yes gene_type:complete
MGYILPEIYQSISNDMQKTMPKVFVETGTFKGGVPLRMLAENGNLEPFKKIYTIELGHDICQIASKRYQLFEKYNCDTSQFNVDTDEPDETFSSRQEYFNGKLTLINGDSTEMLKKLLPTIDEPICFWLDAHAGAQKYARGTDDVPLLTELDAIKNHHIKDHIIAIDDAHMLGQRQYDKNGNVICDYSHVPYDIVKDKLLEINPSYDVGIYDPYDMQMAIAV